jgi:hypothetical protein
MGTRSFLAIAALAPAMLLAQVDKSILTGVVRDSSGGVIAGAVVRIVHLDTQVARSEITDASGIYRFLLADLGTYRLEVAQTDSRNSRAAAWC